MSRFTRASAVAVLAAAGCSLAAPSNAVAASGTGPNAGASYLATQLASGKNIIQTTYGSSSYADTGLTADAILALDALKVGGTQAAASTTAYAANVPAYVGTGGEEYVGATAKSIIVAVAGGQNPANFGGINLTSQLKGLETASGRFEDKSAYGDYSSGFTQALVLIALKKAGIQPDAAAIKYTLSQQCADGGFAQTLEGKTCTSDPDATALMVQGLAAAGGQQASIAKADAYLKSQQGADGGGRGGMGSSGENTNSSGLAAVAFALAGDKAAETKAVNFISSLQYGCSAPESLRGAIAYDKTDFAEEFALGAKAPGLGNEARATAQALLAFAPASYATVTSASSAANIPAVSCSSTGTTKPTTPVVTPTKPSTTPTKLVTTPTKTTSVPATTSHAGGATPVTATAAPTTKPSGTSTAASSTGATTSSSTSKVTGPKINTDGMGSNDDAMLALAAAAVLIAGGGTVAFARRR